MASTATSPRGSARLSGPVCVCVAGPTLAPYVPVAGPAWAKCAVHAAEAEACGVDERCVVTSRASSSSRDDVTGDDVTGAGRCLCVGGFARRSEHEQCRRQSLGLHSSNINLIFYSLKFKKMPCVYNVNEF